jgi:iron complex transport system ATP-binding protein
MELEAKNLSFGYNPGITVLHDISLTLKAGETLFVLGRNGGGKSTLLSCLSGIFEPDKGSVTLDGVSILDYSPAERAQKIGLIPQTHVPTFAYSVQEMVMMGRAPYLNWFGSPSFKDRRIVEEALEQVGLFELRNRAYTEISGGERQLVLIARGLAQQCQILMMDEPIAHLDLSNQHRILEIIQQLRNQGLSFIVSSHAPNDALVYADQVLLLSGGWVLDKGKPREILTESTLSAVYGVRTEVIYEQKGEIKIPKAVVLRHPIQITPDSLDEDKDLLDQIFRLRDKEKQLILVTGMSGAGKTTWCKKLAEEAANRRMVVAGVLSPGRFEEGKKKGIEIWDLFTGEKRCLAKLREKDSDGLSTPRWTFSEDAFNWANQVLMDIPDNDLLVIDELGPLEFLQNQGLSAGLDLIDAGRYKVAVVVVRSSLLPKALQRWPNAVVVRGEIR